jgi:acyl transferase domain-containing protein
MIYSDDGHNRTFDAAGKGSVFGDGVGVVVLKRLEDAITDRDHIFAVIKGSAVNNDGFRKVGYTAPSIEGQVEVIRTAQLMAEVEPESITYIEAHGTATPLGDTVEIEALKQAFNTDKKRFCGIGTVKSNMGHLYSAAGVTGFIKTTLALKHRLIPPGLHFSTPNPQIDFENSPFYVVMEPTVWENNGHPLRAGVSSFGIGGTNAHVVLEEWPGHSSSAERRAHSAERKVNRECQLILLSAGTHSALNKMTENLGNYFKNNPVNPVNPQNPVLPDIAYTLQVGRKHLPYRRMLVTSADGVGALKNTRVVTAKQEQRPVIFMICGQGSQYVNMGIDLYRTEPTFREETDRCFSILKSLTGTDFADILYPHSPHSPHSTKINQTEITQPVLFAFEYALARLLMQWGIKPTAMIGYSFGEYIAACLAGVFSLADALALVIIRGQLVQRTPAGAMASVPLPEDQLKPLLEEEKNVELAIINGPTCIVSGTSEAVAAFGKKMKQKRVLCVPVNMSHAIHSELMSSIRVELENRIREFRLHEPQIPFISNVTAQWLNHEDAVNPRYWGDHLCSTVRFSDGLKELLQYEDAIFIEIGPGRILGMMVRTHPDRKPGHLVLNTVKHPQERVSDDYFLLDKVGQLWLQGQRIDWNAFHGEEKRYRVSLPVYPFEGKRYWLDVDMSTMNPANPNVSFTTQAPAVSEAAGDPGGPGLPGSDYQAPRDELEQEIAQMWQELMGIERVGIHDDFFQLNGSSLVATQIMVRLMDEYKMDVPVNRFYETPTIAHLAEVIRESMEERNKKD